MHLIRLLAVVSLLALVACARTTIATPETLEGGDPRRGRDLVVAYGCVSCHVVPGARGTEASWTAPPLTRFGRRSFVGGVLVNNQPNLIRWLVDPTEVNPLTAMPNVGVTEEDAFDISAYLLSLR
jgi:cytochrome c